VRCFSTLTDSRQRLRLGDAPARRRKGSRIVPDPGEEVNGGRAFLQREASNLPPNLPFRFAFLRPRRSWIFSLASDRRPSVSPRRLRTIPNASGWGGSGRGRPVMPMEIPASRDFSAICERRERRGSRFGLSEGFPASRLGLLFDMLLRISCDRWLEIRLEAGVSGSSQKLDPWSSRIVDSRTCKRTSNGHAPCFVVSFFMETRCNPDEKGSRREIGEKLLIRLGTSRSRGICP